MVFVHNFGVSECNRISLKIVDNVGVSGCNRV